MLSGLKITLEFSVFFWDNKHNRGRAARAADINSQYMVQIMQKIQRKAFTLVELLVVVVIIAMLMGLLTPAIVAARARARQVQCMNNMNEIGKALIQFDLSKQRFPGYVETMPGQKDSSSRPIPINWAVAILPNIQRNDIWDMLRDNSTSITDATLNDLKIELFICPSAQGKLTNQSYVVNTGQADLAITSTNPIPDPPAHGVFLDLVSTKAYKVTASQIPDGSQHTLLLSENLQAGKWNEFVDSSASELPKDLEKEVGIIWWSNYSSAFRINKDKEFEGSNIEHARPSSNHSGGVNVIFCDGHAQFLREDIDYEVYGKLMTPDGKNAKYPNSGAWGGPVTWQNKPLNEADYAD